MKAWWERLNTSEKRTVSLGGMMAFLVLLYVAVWSPISSAFDYQHQAIHSKQQLLDRMRKAKSVVSGEPMQSNNLSQIQTLLKRGHLNAAHELIIQPKAMDFDRLITSLTELIREKGYQVKSFDAIRAPGNTVRSRVVLRRWSHPEQPKGA